MKVKLVAATIAPLLVAACGSLPSSGPTVSEVRGGAQHDDVSQYLVVDIDGRALDQLSTRRDAGLYDSFGTDSGAPSLHIGVGDVVAVTIWEVGPGGLFSGASPSSAVAAAAGAEQSGRRRSWAATAQSPSRSSAGSG